LTKRAYIRINDQVCIRFLKEVMLKARLKDFLAHNLLIISFV